MVYVYEEDRSPENDHNKRMAKLVKFVVDMGSSEMKAELAEASQNTEREQMRRRGKKLERLG